MSDITIRQTEIADRIGDVLAILADDSAPLEDWVVAFAVGQQLRLRLDRSLKARRDDIIVGMERAGFKHLGPLSIKSTAVDPSYPANAAENHEDAGIQEAMVALRADRATRPYIRSIPAHLEIDVLTLAHDVQMGVQAAIDLYRQLNEKGWRKEEARRLSLAVREATPRKAA
ncbi:MAG: hypothetical protein LC798_21200 [Chloroflexi bacterium]|nr:hypothetical protein [Chloroflexota bacterium]